jgi:hypothetical protein
MMEPTTFSGYDFSGDNHAFEESVGTREPRTFFDRAGSKQEFRPDSVGHAIAVDMDETRGDCGPPLVRITVYPPKNLEETQTFVRNTADGMLPAPRHQEEFKLNPGGRDLVKIHVQRDVDVALAQTLLRKIANALPAWP